ncbi:replication-relaxation family protein [Streptomyces sp. NPDC054837]
MSQEISAGSSAARCRGVVNRGGTTSAAARPEVYHSLGSGQAVIPDALLYYRRSRRDGEGWSMLRAFVEVDRATMGPERLATKLLAYERLYRHVPVAVGRPRVAAHHQPTEDWRRRYPLFPRLLLVLDATGPAGIDNRITALRSGAALTEPGFRTTVPILAASLTDILRNGRSAPVWWPVATPAEQVSWTH